MSKLENRIAFITGAASGIGAACALRFVEEGAIVVGFDLNESPEADWLAASQQQAKCELIIGDVTNDEALKAAITKTHEQFGAIDILVNSAGIGSAAPVHLMAVADFDRVMNINLKGTFLASRHALPFMIEKRSGCILNLASVEGLEAQDITAAYNASKGAVVALSKNMSIDYGRLGVRVNAICPGFIETPILKDLQIPEIRDRMTDAHQLGRFGTAREVANVAAFLASDEASFVTGSAITVDGGLTAGKRFGGAALYGLEPEE